MLEKLIVALSEGIEIQRPDVVTMPVQMLPPLTSTAQKILSAIAEHPAITMTQLAENLGINRRTVERNIKVLQQEGRLMRVGVTKSGYWRVV